ncbi:amidase [Microbacterium sp. ZXX196]|uniref:amidase n=1 Tax=Microbacterium sp. ZXX196 TaxID=2609291 RepID=UPI0012B8DA9E|nr:amidase [Microbacterium sp. ZXX196]MTE23077.1 amidase [Microbacterium sp. ZXX196]
MVLPERPLAELIATLAAGEASPTSAVSVAIARAEEGAALGAFVRLTGERALERARALERGAPAGLLWGVPLAEKDLTARAGVETEYGSRAFAGHVPEVSDPLAAALDAAGAVSIGKTNTPEFGLTGYTESAVAPPARNPWDPVTGAGGSSGGAAVAVATGMLPAAPASDGGGSIRIPAATVGVVGLKPSRGRLPFANGLETPGGLSTAGAIARSAEDAAILLDALVAGGPHHFATRPPGHGPFAPAARQDPPRSRIGVTLATPWDGWTSTDLDPAARAAFDRAIRILGGAGHDVADAAWRPVGYPEMFLTLWRASAARIPIADGDLDALAEPLTAWLVREGRALGAAELLAAQQRQAAFERRTIADFAAFDAVLTPALALPPRPVGWYAGVTPEENFARQCSYAPHTSFVNVAGLPAITVPVGGEGRPWSVQLVGRPGGEERILQLARQLEDARGPLPYPQFSEKSARNPGGLLGELWT